jgi:hypothetical protein
MVFSSHLFIFYFLPLVLLLTYTLPLLSLMLVCVSYASSARYDSRHPGGLNRFPSTGGSTPGRIEECGRKPLLTVVH